MKKVLVLTLTLILVGAVAYAQVPQSFSYQSIARESNGKPLTSASIGLRVSVRDLAPTGTIVYRETHTTLTNAFGLFSVSVGAGTVVSGSFATIDWSSGSKFIEVEADFAGGTSYASMGASQLLSVPYALYSQNGTPGPAGMQGPVGPAGPTGPEGLQGPTGLQGPAGTTGAQGLQGPTGLTGPAGASAVNGLSVLSGVGDPAPSTGTDGEFYINITTHTLFGPKAGSAWPTGVFLVGPAGPAGITGPIGPAGADGVIGAQGPIGPQGSSGLNGLSILNGATNPAGTTGANGEFYINTTTNTLFGPKAGGAWPAGVLLVGSQGATGLQGVAGNDGINGADGLNVLYGAIDPLPGSGVDGEFYINSTTKNLFGPKSGGAWPAGISLVGPSGAQGIQGIAGSDGTNGTNGLSVLNGTVNPVNGTGADGEFYINTTSNTLFGPKAAGVWPSGVSLIGPSGTAGTNGYRILNGTADPTGEGIDGEFYLNTTTKTLFGPKAGGAWPVGVSLVGPQGPEGLLPAAVQAGNTPYWDGTSWITNDNIFNDGALVGIGTTSPGAKLDVAGTIKVTDGTEGAGKILTSDATGLASWSNLSSLNPCTTCEVAHATCSAGALGDPDFIAACYDEYMACRNLCEVVWLKDAVKIEAFPRNTLLGYGATLGGSLTNATAVGGAASVSTDNAIQLGNSQVTQVFVGTGTTATLVTGGLKVIGGSPAVGRVLTSDADGVATWQAPGGGGGVNTAGGPFTVMMGADQAARIEQPIIVGSGNTLFGYNAGNTNGGTSNTAVGVEALFSNTGSANIAFGMNALRSNTIGSVNTAIGASALFSNKAGSNATAVGYRAMAFSNNQTDAFLNNNVALGYEALMGSETPSENTGISNTAIGYRSLTSNTWGTQNTAVGMGSLVSNSTGNFNTAVGAAALSENTSGYENTATGFWSLINNITGDGNVADGSFALAQNTTGHINTAVGSYAMQSNSTGSSSVAFGNNALTSSNASFNTAIGANALYTNIDGTNDTGIGYGADVGSGSLTNATAIGNGAIVNASNTIQLGNSDVTQVFAGTSTNATLVAGGLKITGSSPAEGKVLTSDADGVATWQEAAANSGWDVLGNTGTVDGTSFIGTIDDVPLSFMVNNQKAGRIDRNKYNAFFGHFAGSNNSTGDNNTAQGSYALSTNSIGNANTSFGSRAMNSMAGNNNTAVGNHALFGTLSGDNNTFVGATAGSGVTTGSNNTALGYAANVSSGLTNATAIGNGAVASVSSTIQLGNTSVSEATLGNGSTSIFKTGEVRIGSGDYNYSSAKTRYHTIGNAAFIAAGPDPLTAGHNVSVVTGIPVNVYAINGAALGSINALAAPLNLPQGAIITEFTGYVFDSNATYDLTVILTRQPLGTNTIDNIASVASTGAPNNATYTTTSIANGTIDNTGYSYQVVFQSRASGNHAVYQIKVTYTVSKAD